MRMLVGNYFMTNFAPNETKTIKVHINLKDGYSEAVNVWMSTPEIIIPLTLNDTRGLKERYCCVKDKYSCVMDVVCGGLNLADMVTSCFPGSPADIAVSIANCICNVLSTLNQQISKTLCEEDGDIEDFLYKTLNINSWVAPVTSCLTTFLPSGKLKNINDFIGKISSTITASTGGVVIFDCAKDFTQKKPNCPPQDPPQGGSSKPVNSLDPNDIYGYTAESGSKFMRQDIQKINYEIESVTPFADSLRFVFNSEDNRSGVWYHTLYHRNDSTYSEWKILKTRIFDDSFTMKLENLQNSEYLVVATDSA